MPTSEIKFHVLDVGQGACNFVEILNEDGLVSHIMLIDLGTNSRQRIARDNLEWLRQQIIANNRYLDVLIITHGDTDHYNMITKILPAFGEPDGTQIGMVRYGGPRWRYKRGTLITTLEDYTGDLGSFTPSQTSFDLYEEPKWDPIWTTEGADDDPKLQLIVANSPHPRDPVSMVKRQPMNAEAVNTKSVVLGLEWDGYWVLATGDATSTTLADIDFILEYEEADQLPTTFMLTLPHHGSRKTTYDLRRANDIPDNLARGVVDDFLFKFVPKTLSISAGEKRHHHPSMYMIEQFAGHIDADVTYWSDPDLENGRHFLTSWVDKEITDEGVDPAWPARWQYATTQTRDNVYCTLYFKDAQYNSIDYDRYIAPPLPAVASGGGEVEDVPFGRNFEFRMDEDALHVDSTENQARADARKSEVNRSPSDSPRSAFTLAGRAARSGAPQSPQPQAKLRGDPAAPRPQASTQVTGHLHRLKVVS